MRLRSVTFETSEITLFIKNKVVSFLCNTAIEIFYQICYNTCGESYED